ncbi:MAG: hypothetical protein ACUVR8_09355 [Acidobacteriota bacterium]
MSAFSNLSLVTLAGLLAVHTHPPLLVWAFTLYVFWSPWHYTGQNYGIALMFARRHGLTALEWATTRWLWAAFALPYAMLLLAFNSGASADPLLWSAGLPPGGVKAAIAVLLAVFLLITLIIGRNYSTTTAGVPLAQPWRSWLLRPYGLSRQR